MTLSFVLNPRLLNNNSYRIYFYQEDYEEFIDLNLSDNITGN